MGNFNDNVKDKLFAIELTGQEISITVTAIKAFYRASNIRNRQEVEYVQTAGELDHVIYVMLDAVGLDEKSIQDFFDYE